MLLITYSFLPTYPGNRKIKEILMHTRTTIDFTSQWRNVHERNAANLTSSRVHHYYARWIHEYASIPSFVRLFFLTLPHISMDFFLSYGQQKKHVNNYKWVFSFPLGYEGLISVSTAEVNTRCLLSEKKPLDCFCTFASYITK